MRTPKPSTWTAEQAIARLRTLADPTRVAGMARVGISSPATLGVAMPGIRGLAREICRSHALAADLWASGIYEARLLAGMVEQPALVTAEQVEAWAADFDNWAVSDGTILNVISKLPFAHDKAMAWSRRPEEWVRRAAFALMAVLAVHDKKAPDAVFESYLPVIEREASDERATVRKAVNWALRQIGKRNLALCARALESARRIQAAHGRGGKWVASDAIRELTSEDVQKKLR